MTRRSLTQNQRVRIFDAAFGICHLCEAKIHAERGEQWDVSHVIALEAGGKDDPENMRPAHRSCHRQYTAENDAPLIAKTKRQRAAHIGAKKCKSRGFRGWRRMNGDLVWRDDRP